jgi:hypothetical protein
MERAAQENGFHAPVRRAITVIIVAGLVSAIEISEGRAEEAQAEELTM